MKSRFTVMSFLLIMAFCMALAGPGAPATAAPKRCPKAKAPSIELAGVLQKWISEKKKSREMDTLVRNKFVMTCQRVNIIGIVKGTKEVMITTIPGQWKKGRKMALIHKMEYIKKGEKSFEFYVVLPKGEVYPDGDKLKVTDAFVESNRGYGVKYGLRPVLIHGKVEQLPPD